MNVLVVLAHPNPKSLNGALLPQNLRGLKAESRSSRDSNH
jgi:putative NADPH-quinone reductase